MINNPVAPVLNNAAGLGVLIGNLIAMGIIIASIMVLLYLVLGGIEWITSQGEKAGLEQARNRITNALIGLGIVVAAWAIMSLVSSFLGLSFPCLPIPTLDGKPSTCATPATGSKPPIGPVACATFKCQTDADCRDTKPRACGKICDFTKCVATCRSWDNNPISCHRHGESCRWAGTNPNAPPGNCENKF